MRDIERNAHFLKKLRGMRWVKRWNFYNVNHTETVAEHSFFVAIIAGRIATMAGITDPDFVVRIALEHDMEEAITGDIPSLVRKRIRKTHSGMLLSLSDEAFAELRYQPAIHTTAAHFIVKSADLIADILYVQDEIASGNRTLERVIKEDILEIYRLNVPAAIKILNELGYSRKDGVERTGEMSQL